MATVGLIGGTGPEGLGLAMRLALAGETVQIGSRRPERAKEAAETVRAVVGGAGGAAEVSGAVNLDVVRASDVLIVVVPYDGHTATMTDLRDAIGSKIVIDAVVPLVFTGGVPGVVAVPEGSATEQARALLPDARVIGAFHNLSAKKLQALPALLEGDVLITGDDAAAKTEVMALAERMPALRAVDAGPLTMSKFVEDITALILGINRRYKKQAAVRIVGI
jgi:NADPH-dependent F420 reductase